MNPKEKYINTHTVINAREYLLCELADVESLEELYQRTLRMAKMNPQTVKKDIKIVRNLLLEKLPKGQLADIVAWDANWVLEDGSDSTARQWLEDLVDILESTLN